MQAFDFDNAVVMHKSWKMKFHLAIDGIRSRDFDTRPIGDDTQCSLGQWLSANARELEGFGLARELLAAHHEFHHHSEIIAGDIREGKIVHLNDNAIVEFGALSEKIEHLLLQLKAQLQQSG
jgi:succinylglutamate desuccinylase